MNAMSPIHCSPRHVALMTGFAAGALLLCALPAQAASPDPVMAAFERMLDHKPTVANVTPPPTFPSDPLVAAVQQPLWRDAPAVHVPGPLAASAPGSTSVKR